MAKTYDVTVTRDRRWWMIRIPELDGVNGNIEGITQARRLSDIGDEARSYISTVADIAPSTVSMSISVRVGDTDISARAAELSRAREEADAAAEKVAELSAGVAGDLVAAGVPVRDVGTVLGVSHQRAHQLARQAGQTEVTSEAS